MSTVAIVWLVVGLSGTALLLIVLVAMVRQGLLLGRTGMRLVREAGEVMDLIGEAGRSRTPRR